ncbi:hypothetical protein Taro_014045 [Colocasia esculenta]|uniref:Uncharacterized protein n=1 Tax=Colocasia esculenta TaxID=4460 RepID=A0A843UH70_COLES|nr:hypothetical protein [Colocasia esculenta]
MAPAFDARLQLYQQAQQLPSNRVLACDRHPDQQVTGFCASCLRERLAGLDPGTRRLKPSPSSSGAPAAAAAALKSLFSRLPGGQPNHHNAAAAAAVATAPSDTALLPELRRCKSFSGGRGAPPAVAFEPQRRSCDVRRRSTLWSLFHLHEGGADGVGGNPSQVFPPPIYYAASASAGEGEVEIELRSLGLAGPVLETREEEEEEEHYSDAEAGEPEKEQAGEGDGGTREKDGYQELRPMKDHIDLDSQSKKPPPKDMAGGFWLAASVFGEKFRKWRRKHKEKKPGAGPNADARDPPAGTAAAVGEIRAGRLSSRSRRLYRDAQSEVAEDAFGRRSCDTDPRFSLDAGMVSFDDPRYSWDEPRASWDGYLLGGGRQAFPRLPPMLSVIEDAPIAAAPSVQRSDGQIPVEEDAAVPGGTAQTREYYSDSLSQRRRRSLDRSSSVRRPSFEAADEPLPTKGSSNSRVSPTATANEYFFHHVSRFDRDNRDSRSNSLRDDCSESFESTYRDPLKDGEGSKKSRRWCKAWSLWGLVHRRGNGNGAVAANVVERSLSESWPELRRAHSGKFFRSNSSVSSRNSFSYGNGNIGLSSIRRNGVEMNVHSGMKRREEFVLERNRSARYSPSHAGNGLLRFYLTPMSSSRRTKGPVKGWHKNTHPLARSMLRLY